MKIRRFVTAEQADGGVFIRQEEPIPDTSSTEPATVLWGWDDLPALPIRPDDLGPQHVERELFPPAGGASVNLVVFPPGGGGAMHRTDSVDFAFVLEGEVVLRHPGNDDITLRPGDFFVQNGAEHEWLNSSADPCVMACVVLAAERAGE